MDGQDYSPEDSDEDRYGYDDEDNEENGNAESGMDGESGNDDESGTADAEDANDDNISSTIFERKLQTWYETIMDWVRGTGPGLTTNDFIKKLDAS